VRRRACLVKRGRMWSVKQPLPDGRYRWRTVGTRKKDAEALRDELNRRAALGAASQAPAETFGVFADAWLVRYRQRVKPAVHKLAEGGIAHLEPLHSRQIETLTRAELEDHIVGIAQRTPRTAVRVLQLLKRVLADAKARGQVVDENIFRIQPPRYREREPYFPTWEEADELASWMPEYVARIVPVALATGLRQGELFALRDSDIDLERRRLTVRKAKTPSGVRTIELADVAVNLLREQLLARTPSTHGLVFPTLTGKQWDRHGFMHRAFRPATRRARLEQMTFHDLRHGFVSLMAKAGVHPTVIARLVGHADGGALLMRRYRHLFPDETRAAVAKLDQLVRGGVAQVLQADTAPRPLP
jgi:integrase